MLQKLGQSRVTEPSEAADAFAKWLLANRLDLSAATCDLARTARVRMSALTGPDAEHLEPLREAATQVARTVAAAEAYVPTAHSAPVLGPIPRRTASAALASRRSSGTAETSQEHSLSSSNRLGCREGLIFGKGLARLEAVVEAAEEAVEQVAVCRSPAMRRRS